MPTQQEIIEKFWPKPSKCDVSNIKGMQEAIKEMMDEWGKDMIIHFGEYKLLNDLRYDRGVNQEWGKLSYHRQVDQFFNEIITAKNNQ